MTNHSAHDEGSFGASGEFRRALPATIQPPASNMDPSLRPHREIPQGMRPRTPENSTAALEALVTLNLEGRSCGRDSISPLSLSAIRPDISPTGVTSTSPRTLPAPVCRASYKRSDDSSVLIVEPMTGLLWSPPMREQNGRAPLPSDDKANGSDSKKKQE